MKRRYEMTEADLAVLVAASGVGLGAARSGWIALSREMKFDVDTVEPACIHSMRTFLAEPAE